MIMGTSFHQYKKKEYILYLGMILLVETESKSEVCVMVQCPVGWCDGSHWPSVSSSAPVTHTYHRPAPPQAGITS